MINKSSKPIPQYIQRLISKIEKAPDFGYDDEECELCEWCKQNNHFSCWNDSLFKAEILITDNEDDIIEIAKIRGIEYERRT